MSYVNEQEGGYVLPQQSEQSTGGIGLSPVSLGLYDNSYTLSVGELHLISNCLTPCVVKLPPAIKSGRRHVVINRGGDTLTVQPADTESIDSETSLVLWPGVGVELIDSALYLWTTASSYGTSDELFLTHTILPYGADPGRVLTSWRNTTLCLRAAGATTVTLPPAILAGQRIVVFTTSDLCSWTDAVTVAAAGSDLIAGAASTKLWVPYARITLQCSSPGNWSIIDRSPKLWYARFISTTDFVSFPDAVWYKLRAVGAGGGGANAGLQGGTTYHGGGGGGAGAWAEWEGQLPGNTTYTITIGAGGVGRAAGTSLSGGNGGTTSFGAVVSAAGGNGGTRGASGGTAGTGGTLQTISSINIVGHPQNLVSGATFTIPAAMRLDGGNGGTGAGSGSNGSTLTPAWFAAGLGGTSANCSNGGGGAASPFGAGGNGGYRDVSDVIIAATAGSGYGSGGGGAALKTADGSDGPSAAGAPGCVEVWVWF